MADPIPCPVCGKPFTGPARLRPFCSLRCSEVDLGRWFGGQYRIPGPEADEEEAPLDPRPGLR